MSEYRDERKKAVDNSVKMIALARKTCEIAGESVEEFDKELNELCERWHEKFAGMDAVALGRFMVSDLINSALDMDIDFGLEGEE